MVTREFKVNIGEIFKDKKRDITIIDREYRLKERTDREGRKSVTYLKWYKYRCNKCGYDEGWIEESKLLHRTGCSCCCRPAKILVPNINSIGVTNPELIQYFKDKDEAFKHLKGSKDKVILKCPICEQEKEEMVSTLYSVGTMGCTCGDGFSYPEKFMMECLKQTGINFTWQLTGKHFSWIGRKRYDFYFELNGEKYIIETHGKQHPNTLYYSEKTFGRKDEGKNDKLKYELAISNGIKPQNYIVIDCSCSEKDFISKNILNSRLNDVLNLSNINWDNCDEVGFKNIVKQSCEMFNNGMNTNEIMKEFNISRTTVCRYLNIGTERNWCNYTGKEEQKKRLKEWSKNNINPLIVYDYKTNELIGIFDKPNSCIEYLKTELNVSICEGSIYRVLKGEYKQTKGFIFKRITEEEYYNYIKK